MFFEAMRVASPAGELGGWSHEGRDPDAVPVLLLHPINMQGKIWFEVCERLGDERSYFMPDLRAHGTSDSGGEFGLDEWLADIEAFVDEFCPNSPMHVVGGSLGGSLAVCFAASRPESVVSLTAIGSSLRFEGVDVQSVLDEFDKYGVRGTFERVFPELTFGPDATAEMIEEGLRLSNPNPVEIVKRVWAATVSSNSSERAAKVYCPALVLTGQFDQTCTPSLAMEMANALKTELTLIPRIGHLPMLEAPERVAAQLDQHFMYAEKLSETGSHQAT